MKISLIIPIYGVERYISRCVHNLFNQSGAELEYIFVNDATQDSSMEILRDIISKEYSELKDKVNIINKPINEGLPQARKTGVAVATGDYIMHCDSDDWLADGAIKIIAEEINRTNADIIYFGHYISVDGKARESIEKEQTSPFSYLADIISFSSTSGAFCWNKVIKRELYDYVEEWPKYNMHEDVALMPQIIYHATSISFINQPLYYYRCDSTSSMSNDYQKNKEKRMQSKENMQIVIRFMEKNNLTKILRKQYQQLISRCAYNAAFFDKKSIPRELPLYASLWKFPIFFNFDVSIRRQLQSRIVIMYYHIKHWLSFAQ